MGSSDETRVDLALGDGLPVSRGRISHEREIRRSILAKPISPGPIPMEEIPRLGGMPPPSVAWLASEEAGVETTVVPLSADVTAPAAPVTCTCWQNLPTYAAKPSRGYWDWLSEYTHKFDPVPASELEQEDPAWREGRHRRRSRRAMRRASRLAYQYPRVKQTPELVWILAFIVGFIIVIVSGVTIWLLQSGLRLWIV